MNEQGEITLLAEERWALTIPRSTFIANAARLARAAPKPLPHRRGAAYRHRQLARRRRHQ